MEAEHVEEAQRVHPGFVTALLAGAASGLSVDLLFFPIDTIKHVCKVPRDSGEAAALRACIAAWVASLLAVRLVHRSSLSHMKCPSPCLPA